MYSTIATILVAIGLSYWSYTDQSEAQKRTCQLTLTAYEVQDAIAKAYGTQVSDEAALDVFNYCTIWQAGTSYINKETR